MNVKNIEICTEPDCPVCALTRQLMEVTERHTTTDGELNAERCVALSHAIARWIYAESKDPFRQVELISWLSDVTARAVSRLKANDRVEH